MAPRPRKPISKEEHERRARQRADAHAERLRRVQARTASHSAVYITPFLDWCVMRGISPSTGRRLANAGKVRITHMSARRIGVRSDHDAQFLAAASGEA